VRTWARALRFFRPELKRTLFALALLILSIGAGVLKPWPLALIVDSLLQGKPLPDWLASLLGPDNTHRLLWLCASIVFLHAAQGGFSAWANFVSIKAGLLGLFRVRNELFRRMQRLSMRFYQSHDTGDLIYRASWDTYAFQTLFQQGFFNLLTALLSLAMMVVVMWQLNAWLTVVTFAVFPPMLLAMLFFGREMQKRSLAAHQADSAVTSIFQQNITALPLILANTREEHEQTRFRSQSSQAVQTKAAQHGWELLYWLVIALVFGFGSAAIAWSGAKQAQLGELTVGQLLIFLSYLAQIYDPLNQLSKVGATVSDASAGAGRVLEILDAAPEVANSVGAAAVAQPHSTGEGLRVRGEVEMRGLQFSYRAGSPVLQNINLKVRAGESVAIIGPSGSGKTTLLNLILRFYDPDAGALLIEGRNARELDVQGLRSNMSLVLQEPLLLASSVAENIAYGRPGATSGQIREAARQASALEFIENLPKQFNTIVGEGAARLSVGERQRLNLARAFLRDAPILLLDEPTSALDAESEQAVVNSLEALMRGRTTFIVAHRLSTIRNVDRIIVLEGGRIIDEGSPETLARRDSYYARMLSTQA